MARSSEMPAGERIRIGDRLYWRENGQWIWSHVSGGWSAVYESTADLLDEVERLRRWKAEALDVIDGWEQAFDLVPEWFLRNRLGQPKSEATAMYIHHLRHGGGAA